MPNFKKSNKGYMMKPKGMGGQAYTMMGGQDPKKKSKQKQLAGKLAKGIRDFHIGAAGFIGPGGVAKGLKSLGNVKNLSSAIKQIKSTNFGKAVGQISKAFSNAPKQYMRGPSKNVPVVGKPGKTVKVPKSSKTKQVSYVNPRISMTAAERRKAGY